jgi:translation initiation factor 3 subunit L
MAWSDQEEPRGYRVMSNDEEAESDSDRLPDSVTHFLRQLEDNVKRGNADEVFALYEEHFNKLTERYFGKQRWPHADTVTEYISDPFTLLLYKEMYYRHIYSRLQPSFEERNGSWENYTALTEFILGDMRGDCKTDLPAQWVWDFLDEFVYQFQTFTMFRNKQIKANNEDMIEQMKANMSMWNSVKVYSLLHNLVKESGVNEYLAQPEEQRSIKVGSSCKIMFGYFALTQLLRMECLYGDYHMALKAIEFVDFGPASLYHKVAACHTTMHYYTGFSYLMMRRYQDAVRTFQNALVHQSRARLSYSLSYQQDQIAKKTEQMTALLLLSNALSPMRLDESLLQNIKDKYFEKQQKLQKGDETTFEELFSYSCPKFISPTPPDWDALETFNPNEAHQRQLKLFLQEVQQQQKFPEIRAYLRLYSAMPVAKLSQFLEFDEENLRTLLMCYKFKNRQIVRTAGAPLDGAAVSNCDINFSLEGSMMHMVAQKPQQQYTDVFLQNIVKFQDIIRTIEGKPIAA